MGKKAANGHFWGGANGDGKLTVAAAVVAASSATKSSHSCAAQHSASVAYTKPWETTNMPSSGTPRAHELPIAAMSGNHIIPSSGSGLSPTTGAAVVTTTPVPPSSGRGMSPRRGASVVDATGTSTLAPPQMVRHAPSSANRYIPEFDRCSSGYELSSWHSHAHPASVRTATGYHLSTKLLGQGWPAQQLARSS